MVGSCTLEYMRLSFVLCAWIVGSGVAAADPLDGAPFSAKPADLIALAKATPSQDAPVLVLRDDETITYDDHGRVERRYDIVAVIEKPAAVDGWGTLELGWSPFYQDKPSVRARVIASDGSVAELDPKLISDAPVVEDSPNVFSDRRTMQAPLPRLAVGAVIEEQYTITDREPLLSAGETDLAYVGRGVPVRRSRVTISAPAARALHVVARGFAKAPAPHKSSRGGRTTWAYDLGATAADDHDVTGVPADVAEYPYIGVASGASWAAVAKDYRRLVDERTKDGLPLPDGVRGATPRETVDRAVAWLHAHVRYTGIELRDSAIVPWAPAEISARGFGDCKDKAALLVALLRGAGLRADLAVLWTGPGTDVDRELPGLGVFDHAIVRAKVDGKDLWIDATEDTLPAGQLPARDQGRLALIVADDTTDLVTTPVAAPADNLVHEVHTYHVAEIDHGTVTETAEERGVYWDNLRDFIRDKAQADATKSLSSYVEHEYRGKLSGFSGNHPAAITQPFVLTLQVADAARVDTDREEASVWLFASDTLRNLPDLLTETGAATDARVKARTIDYVFTIPHVYEIENRIELPPGFTAPTLVARDQQALGTMTFTTTRRLDGNDLVITYRLDTGKRRITTAELATTRAAVLALQKANAEHVLLAQTGASLLQAGKIKEAIAEFQRLIALHPKEALHQDQLANAYSRAGMGAAARRVALAATKLEPTSGDAFSLLAWQLRRDSLGREYGFDADRAGAIAAYHKALALTPKHMGAMHDLAELLVVDERGRRDARPADRLEAIATYRRLTALSDAVDYQRGLIDAMLDAGQYADADAAARTLAESEDSATLQVVAAALARGPAEAIAIAGAASSGAQRTRVLSAAARRLMALRAYDAMRALVAEVSTGAPDPRMAKFARIDLDKLGAADPKRPALLAMLAVSGIPVAHPPWGPELALSLHRAGRAVNLGRDWTELPPAVTADVMAAGVPFVVDGNPRDGWQVRADLATGRVAFYVVLDHGQARLIGDNDLPAGVGRLALALLARNDVAGATRWIDQLVTDLDKVHAKPWAPAIKLYRDEQARASGKPPAKAIVELVAALAAGRTDGRARRAGAAPLRRPGRRRQDAVPAGALRHAGRARGLGRGGQDGRCDARDGEAVEGVPPRLRARARGQDQGSDRRRRRAPRAVARRSRRARPARAADRRRRRVGRRAAVARQDRRAPGRDLRHAQ